MTTDSIITGLLEEAREADREEREQLGKSYDHNSYGSGYNNGYIEALKELRNRIRRRSPQAISECAAGEIDRAHKKCKP